MIRGAALLSVACGVSMIAGCDRPSADARTASIAVPVRRSVDTASCEGPVPADAARDALGAAWRRAEGMWCRRAPDGRQVQAWAEADDAGATHLVHIRDGQAALTDRPPTLAAVEPTPPPPPFAPCADDARMRAFASQNWLLRPGDLACGAHRGGRFVIAPVGFAAARARVPVLLATPRAGGPSRGTILFVKGGPYQNLIHGLTARALTGHLLARWAGRATIAIPAFLGVDRVRVGEGDFAAGQAELAALLEALARRDEPVCVVAFSMGAAAVAPLVRDKASVQFLMLAPLAASPSAFVDRARALGTPTPPVRLDPAGPGRRGVTLPADAATLAYFGRDAERSLVDRLGGGRHNNVRIAYAADDVPITADDAKALAPLLGPGSIHRLPRVDHSVEDPYAFTAYQPVVDRFLASCLPSSSTRS